MLFVLYREGDLKVIRPFVYVREKELRQFAEQVLLVFLFVQIETVVFYQDHDFLWVQLHNSTLLDCFCIAVQVSCDSRKLSSMF